MGATLILIGVGCIIGAIIGGGVKLVQIELSPVASLWRQMILGVFGAVLVLSGVAANGQFTAAHADVERQSATAERAASSDAAAATHPDRPAVGSGEQSPAAAPAVADRRTGSDYVLPDSQDRPLVPADLQALSRADLRIARNEIYARHGRIFKSQDLANYFAGKSWYRPVAEDVVLSPVEQANVALLARAEQTGG